MAVEAFLQGHLGQEVVDADGDRLLNHAVEGHRPGPDRQGLGRIGDVLARAELVVVVVAGDEILGGQRTVELVGVVAFEGIELGRGIGIRGLGLVRMREDAGTQRQQQRSRRQPLGEIPPIDIDRLRRRRRFRQLPAALATDMHESPLLSYCLTMS